MSTNVARDDLKRDHLILLITLTIDVTFTGDEVNYKLQSIFITTTGENYFGILRGIYPSTKWVPA